MNEHTSARAVLDLNQKGIKNTAALLGGWNSWREANLPFDTTPTTEKPAATNPPPTAPKHKQ